MSDLSGPSLLVDPSALLVAAEELTAASGVLATAACIAPPDAGPSTDEVAAALARVASDLSELADRLDARCTGLMEVAASYASADGSVTFPGIGTFGAGSS